MHANANLVIREWFRCSRKDKSVMNFLDREINPHYYVLPKNGVPR